MKYNSYVRCFSVLSNELRMDILNELQEREMNVGELAEKLGIEQSRASHALKQLKKCGFVKAERSGKEIAYSLNKSAFESLKARKGESLMDIVKRHYEKCPYKEGVR